MRGDKLKIEKKKYGSETAVTSVRLPIDMIKKLDEIAQKSNRNRNEIILTCLEYAIKNLED